ncbi:fibronectin type III domain-containing protein [Streptomyces sp. NPDC006784]|uniref:fibronectin type III domain-containing protein n=1 Tax=Streptomyces sp. NPDC006784 TaxID=3364764 RepID=UPI0036A901D7
MAITEVFESYGSWDLRLKPTAPPELWDRVQYFGHIAVVPGRVDPVQYGDSLLNAAAYVGVIRRRETTGDDRRTKVVEQGYTIGGVGMEVWLGDEDDKGSVFETPVDLADATFSDAVRALLPASGAVTEGTLYSVPGDPGYGGRHHYETPRTAISYVCDTVGSAAGVRVSHRVNGNGTLDAGPEADLYVTDPRCVISRIPAGVDAGVESIPGGFAVARDSEDYSTRVVLLAEGEGESIATASADLDPGEIPYKDIHGNALAMTRMVSESDTTVANADARAELALGQYTTTQNELKVETDNYYIEGSFNPGDYVWAYDPDSGIVDTSNELIFRGERINPMRLQVTEKQWPVTADYTVAYRAPDGSWWDLTDHMEWDGSETVYATIGDFARSLTGAGTEPVGTRPSSDTSTPAAPQLVEPFVGSAYLDARGFTRARVILAWQAPNNEDGSTVLDGDHFEIRWAIDTDMIYPATWTQVSQVRWMDLQIWAQPFAAPDDDWQTMYVAWGESTAQLQDLSPGVGYDVQIRAVDKAGNIGAWSPVTTFVASEDNVPPSTPAPPQVAASRIAVQVTHELGKSSGGTFNLERDLHHLEVHVSYEPGFTPDETTLLTKVSATAGMLQGQVPVVVTVQVEETSERYVRVIAVDETGNKSGPSDAASATALLIDDAHISDLTVSKVTAGTITASWVLAGEIKTADSGARARMSMDGYELYNAGGTRTFFAEAETGNVEIIGQLASGTTGQRMVINPMGIADPQIRFYPVTGTEYGLIRSYNSLDVPGDPSVMMRSGAADDGTYGLSVCASDRAFIGQHTYNVFTQLWDPQGGSLFTNADSARLSYYDTLGTDDYGGAVYLDAQQATIGVRQADFEEAFIAIDNVYGSITAVGEIETRVDPQTALIVGNMTVSGGPYTSFIRTYGPTYTGIPRVIPYVWDGDASGSTIRPHMLTANSSTGFTGTFSGNSTSSFTCYWWAWRIN